jgi:hypothetical protein
MIALIDADSLFYLSCYKLDDPAFVEKCGLSNEDAETIIESLAEVGADRLENMLNDIILDKYLELMEKIKTKASEYPKP